jgi:phosphopantothenoylcysteine decarboxylase/phosphopantothenate--cysteine ligase
VVAPATGNFIGKVAAGIADDLLTTIVMAKQSDVIIATAMNTEMFCNPIVQRNIEKLALLGYHFVMPESGELACKTVGVGRLAEPEDICERIEQYFSTSKSLAGKKLVVTAGPTIERLDPVRYISNFSSGKMGYAIAAEAAARGAETVLISGPTALGVPAGVTRFNVEAAEQMLTVVTEHFDNADATILCAAVADFRPAHYSNEKIPHTAPGSIPLKANPDIAAEIGKMKRSGQITVGFALETDSDQKRAEEKLRSKNLDFIVMNNPTVAGVEFGSDDNIATLIFADGKIERFDRLSKRKLAGILIDRIFELMTKGSAWTTTTKP